ncbi:hypothetical protein AGMMS50239_09900 [Bacteroidia bacterium]|nr:hypothetical protein AGMMS50239_09900 [Bacteroidia bacterium]
MFKAVFSFSGRIRRLEYFLSLIGVCIIHLTLNYIGDSLIESLDEGEYWFFLLLYISINAVLLWILLAQGAKRCHDFEQSGGMQLIPFYGLVMLFKKGDDGSNEYGEGTEEEFDNFYQENSKTNSRIRKKIKKKIDWKKPFKAISTWKNNLNQAQRIIIAICIPLILFVLTYAMASLMYDDHHSDWSDMEGTCVFGFYVLVIGIFEYFLFSDKKGKNLESEKNNGNKNNSNNF